MELTDDKTLDGFLGNVDKINEVIKNLSSEDETERDKAIAEADKLLLHTDIVSKKRAAPDRTGVNRTLINKNAYKTPDQVMPTALPQPVRTGQDQGQEAFMKALEKDANERSERKRLARVEATTFKDQGNSAFKSGEFEQAVQFYSKGLDKLKDFKELWTNRAQAYIRLGNYAEALSDCDWAQRCDESYVKAYVLEAKAHLGLKDYEAAINIYTKAIDIDKTKEGMMKEYIREAELARDSANEEKDAKELFESGAQHPATLLDVMKKVLSEGELPLYYDGGVRVLADLLTDDKCRTLFRAEGGLEIYYKHPFFARSMVEASLESLGKEELDACSGMFSLLTAATRNNGESQRQLLCQELFPRTVIRFIDCRVLKKRRQLKRSCLSLLLSLSEGEIGRKYLSIQFDITQLLQTLFGLVDYGDALAVHSLNIVNNMALEGRFRKALYDCMDTVLSSFERLLVSDKHTEVIPSCVTIMTNLCTDDRIRKAMSARQNMITASLEYLNKYPSGCLDQCPSYQKAVHAALGFLMNVTLNKSDAVKSSALSIAQAVVTYLDKQTDIQERALGCLSHVLPLSTQVTEFFIKNQSRVKLLIDLLAQPLHMKYTVKSLTACTQCSKSVCQQVAADKQAVLNLLQLLSDDNEVLLGNACLCLSHCIAETAVNEVVDRDHMKRLLVVVREAKSSTVKQNAAILVGKLVTANPRHLETLRELDGIGILHNSTRYYKL